MHTYKDAIRNTKGAFILYPGSNTNIFGEFNEIIPGIGALYIRPSKSDSGIDKFKKFLLEIIDYCNNHYYVT